MFASVCAFKASLLMSYKLFYYRYLFILQLNGVQFSYLMYPKVYPISKYQASIVVVRVHCPLPERVGTVHVKKAGHKRKGAYFWVAI